MVMSCPFGILIFTLSPFSRLIFPPALANALTNLFPSGYEVGSTVTILW